MRGTILVLIILGSALAGCIGSDGSDGSDENLENASADELGAAAAVDAADWPTLSDGTPAPGSLTVTGCDEHFGVFPVLAAQVEPFLPDGFSLVAFDPAGALATLLILSYACELEEDGSRSAEMHGAIVVEPPEDLAREDAMVHVITVGAFIDNERVLDVWDAWGFDSATAGTVDLMSEVTPAGRVGTVTGGDDGFAITMATAAVGEPGTQAAGVARVFMLDHEGESLAGIVDVSWTESHTLEMGAGAELVQVVPPGVMGLPYPVEPGLAGHYWGDDYDITYTYVPMPMDAGGDAGGAGNADDADGPWW